MLSRRLFRLWAFGLRMLSYRHTQYLPQQLSAEEITEILKQLIAENGISSIRDMGKLMGLATKKFAGQADNKLVSEIVKSLLS